ncbi:pyridoxal phosphate-dependent aminotransferase [Paenibacillus albicereus]|uniref:cysteine-S-conjugate beta-lyase n=1 Tax=Paenibacillus albicereus TaxID=2726185 RepID=A0A6H2GVA3_9BACL|nr:MalY/PatB family protein [Paenibacillus albicereus]QJC51096.1 pyridoxal phosphate-dependent aminotransferase [Paenibacillus albicereus]
MTRHTFDNPPSFEGIASEKWDLHKGKDILPLWVADMDFPAPPSVLDALERRIGRGVLGYTTVSAAYKQAVAGWMARRHGWQAQPEWVRFCPGVVVSLSVIVRACTQPGDAVVIQPPVYPPFRSVVEDNGRELVLNPLLRREDGRYEMNFAQLEEQLAEERVKLLILCSPHNPVGRVWTREELLRVAELCGRHGVLVVSDEIHADLVFEPGRFVPFASISEEAAALALVCTSPSKTFNIAGMNTSNMVIPNPQLRTAVTAELKRGALGSISALGHAAVIGAYEGGEDWLEEALAYIRANQQFLVEALGRSVPELSVAAPEGTYLLWLDCLGLGLADAELHRFFLEKARIQLSPGSSFVEGGAGFMRLNAACSRATAEEAARRIAAAVQELRASR